MSERAVLWNAQFAISRSPLPHCTEVRLLQDSNARSPIFVTLSGRLTRAKERQLVNARFPMTVNVEGSWTLVKLLLLQKTLSPMLVIPSERTREVM